MTAAPSFHPVANLFPLIQGAEFDELVSDVKANGLREPIVLLDNQILDGRNRYRAAKAAGVEPQYVTYEGDDPVAFAISLNLRRRHLSESQRAWVASQIANLGLGSNQHSQICEPSITREKAAELLNVSPRSVDSARVVRDRGAPELQEKVAAWGNQAPQGDTEDAPEAGDEPTGGEVVAFPQRAEITTTVEEPEATPATPAQQMLERIRCLTEAAGTFKSQLRCLTGAELAEVREALAATALLQHAVDQQTTARRLEATRRGRPARKAAANTKGGAR